MKKLFFLLIPVFFASCSPRIAISVINEKPAAAENETVEVYNKKEQIASGYEVLGLASAVDGGMTVNCDSLLMMSQLKQEVRKIGGNAVLITEHKRPSFWTSSCHQFKGVILRVSDDVATDDATFDNAILAASRQRSLPHFTINTNVGPAWGIGDIPNNLDPYTHKLAEDLKSGYQMNFGVDYYFHDNYGVRLAYQRFNSTSNQSVPAAGVLNGEIAISAIYPAFVIRFGSNDQKWIFDGSFGVGYIHKNETSSFRNNSIEAKGSTVCGQFTLGAQYLITKDLGIGLNFTSTSGVLSKMKINENRDSYTINLKGDDRVSANQIGLLFGIRYHIR